MRWMLSHAGVFVRGGDGALARTRVVAPGCVGDGGGVFWEEVPPTPGVPTCPHWSYAPPCVACEGVG